MPLTNEEKKRIFEEEKLKKEMSGKSALIAIILSSFIAGLGDLYCGSFVKAFIFFGLDLLCLLLTLVGIGFFLYIPVSIAGVISAWLSASKSEKKKIQKLEKSFGMSNEQKENQKKPTLLKNPFLYLAKKIKGDPVPFIFFGSLIGLKIYHFINKIDFVSEFMGIMYGIDQSLTGIKAILFSRPVLDLIYTIVAILFDGIIIFSYIIRVKPNEDHGKAQGFRERWFPIITVLLPMIVFTYLIFYPFPLQHDPLFNSLYQSTSLIHSVIMAGLALSLIGCVLSIVALWKLRNSFSLMVEVRQLVTTGMYKYMRHPLYFSELIHALGTTLLLLNSISLPAYIIFFTLEIIRAKFEERKFLELLPEYADYKAKTGFFYPKFSTPSKKSQRAAQQSFQGP